MKRLVFAVTFFLTSISFNSFAVNPVVGEVSATINVIINLPMSSPGYVFVMMNSNNANFYISPTDPNYETEVAMLIIAKSKGTQIDVNFLNQDLITNGSTTYAPISWLTMK